MKQATGIRFPLEKDKARQQDYSESKDKADNSNFVPLRVS
jgi:hypothetical protein